MQGHRGDICEPLERKDACIPPEMSSKHVPITSSLSDTVARSVLNW